MEQEEFRTLPLGKPERPLDGGVATVTQGGAGEDTVVVEAFVVHYGLPDTGKGGCGRMNSRSFYLYIYPSRRICPAS
jgi:hypothetical protein